MPSRASRSTSSLDRVSGASAIMMPPASLTRPPHRFSTLLRGSNKRVPDMPMPLPVGSFPSPFEHILARSTAWQEDDLGPAVPHLEFPLKPNIKSLLEENEDADGYKSDSSEDLETLRLQFASVFSGQAVRSRAPVRSTVVVPCEQPFKQTAFANLKDRSRIEESVAKPRQSDVARPASHPSVAGWVETGRYGGEGDLTSMQASRGHVQGKLQEGEEDEDVAKLVTAFKSLQERIHSSMASGALSAPVHSMTASPVQLRPGTAPSVQGARSIDSYTSGSRPQTSSLYTAQQQVQQQLQQQQQKQQQPDRARQHEQLNKLPADLEHGSAAGAASLRAGTTRRHIADVYDDGSMAATVRVHDHVQPMHVQPQRIAHGQHQAHALHRSSPGTSGVDRRSNVFGGDKKEWETSSAVIRQQFASLYSALSAVEDPRLVDPRDYMESHLQQQDLRQDLRHTGDETAAVPAKDKPASTAQASRKRQVAAATEAGAGKRSAGVKEKESAGSKRLASATDGITISLSQLRQEIEATSAQYHSNKMAMQASRASRPLRAEQRKACGKLRSSRETESKESRRLHEAWEDESRGRSWAMKLKEMNQLVRDLEPLIDMATATHEQRPSTAPASRSRLSMQPHDKSDQSETLGHEDEGHHQDQQVPQHVRAKQRLARPATAGSVAGKGSRSGGDSLLGGQARARGIPGQNIEKDRGQAWYVPERVKRRGDGAKDMQEATPMAGKSDLLRGDDKISKAQCEADLATGAYSAGMISFYSRDEAIGVRPRSRRGRGMLTRDSLAVDDQASHSHQHLMEAVPVGDDETGHASASGQDMSTSRRDSTGGEDGRIVPKRDEAIGARPPTRRGRPVEPPQKQHNQHHGYEEGAVVDGGDAGRELFSDCTTPDAPDEESEDDDWQRRNGILPGQGHVSIPSDSGYTCLRGALTRAWQSGAGGMGVSEVLMLSESGISPDESNASDGVRYDDKGPDGLDDDNSSAESDDNGIEGDEYAEDNTEETAMWRKQEQVLKYMLERQEEIFRRSKELAVKGLRN